MDNLKKFARNESLNSEALEMQKSAHISVFALGVLFSNALMIRF